MIVRAFVCAAFTMAASTALAQQKEPIARFAADVRVTSSGLPNEAGWTPVVPAGTDLPGRAFGLDIGAHVYVVRWRAVALGVGASWLLATGNTSPPQPAAGAPTAVTIPDVRTRFTTLAPQVSLNFGHAMGWSYVSAGLGRSNVESEATFSGTIVPTRTSDAVKTLNFGGGARWFLNQHVGVGLDLRWHKLSLVEASAAHPGAPRASIIAAGAGIVFK